MTGRGEAGAGRRSVLVVGGGVVGLSCAWFLRRRGHEVTVFERGTVGGGASRGNAGLVCPALADPLPAPGIMRHTLRGLLRADSPLFVHPRAVPSMANFLLRFAASTTEQAYRRGLQALAGLDRLTLALFDELVAAAAIEPMEGLGFVMAFDDVEAAEHARRVQAKLARAGLGSPPGPLLAGRKLAELEPMLSERVRSGFLQPDERWVDPSRLVDALARALREEGVTIIDGTAVTSLAAGSKRVMARTASGAADAEVAVIAAGAWSSELGRSLGISLGIRPGKGYSFSVQPEVLPRRPIYLPDAHIVATPIAGGLRIAGTMEFDGTFDQLNRKRIRAMIAAVRPRLRGIDWEARTQEWVGPRPMTPDGLPLIGELPGRPGILVASGHNMLGLTLAPATGRVVADLVTSGTSDVDIAAFSPTRFAGLGRQRS